MKVKGSAYRLAFLIILLYACNKTDKRMYEPVQAFNNTQVELTDSWIKERQELNRNFLYKLDPDRLLHNFRVNAGIKSDARHLEGWEHPNCGLRGHFVGHYLSACALYIQRDGDSILSKRLTYMVDAFEECQKALGGLYLSAFPESDFTTLETQYGGVWAPYYTYHKVMQGLLDVYTRTGNEKAYRIVLGMADYVEDRMSRLSAEEIEKILYTAQANPSNEPGGMNDVLHQLYQISGNQKHLKLAAIFDRDWLSKPLSKKIDILSGLHSNTHLIQVCGFTKRYENTREIEYQNASVNFWDMLANHHCYANGSSSGPRPIATTPTSETAEHWGKPDGLSTTFSGRIAESCVTHNTQKLTAELFSWAADPKYADFYLNTYYNGVLASQNAESGQTVYHLPLASPRKKHFLTEEDFRCCNGSAIEAFANLNQGIYYHTDQAVWVNVYVPSVLNWTEKGIQITQTGNFTEDGIATFTIKAKNETPLMINLLIPSWAGDAVKIKVNGKPENHRITPMSYLSLERKWKNNDQIELQFDFDFHIKSTNDNENVCALFYGPNLLAFKTTEELILKGDKLSIVDSIKKSSNKLAFLLNNNGKQYGLIPFYRVTQEDYGVYFTIENNK